MILFSKIQTQIAHPAHPLLLIITLQHRLVQSQWLLHRSFCKYHRVIRLHLVPTRSCLAELRSRQQFHHLAGFFLVWLFQLLFFLTPKVDQTVRYHHNATLITLRFVWVASCLALGTTLVPHFLFWVQQEHIRVVCHLARLSFTHRVIALSVPFEYHFRVRQCWSLIHVQISNSSFHSQVFLIVFRFRIILFKEKLYRSAVFNFLSELYLMLAFADPWGFRHWCVDLLQAELRLNW